MPTPPHETPFDRYRAKHKLGTSTPTEAALFNAGYSEGLADGIAMARDAQTELDRKASELAAEQVAWETERDRAKAEQDARERALNARAASALPPQPVPTETRMPEPAKDSFRSKALVVVLAALLVIALGGLMVWLAWPSIKSAQTEITNAAVNQGTQAVKTHTAEVATNVNTFTSATVGQAVTDINQHTDAAVAGACNLPAMALECQTLVDQANSKDPSIRAQVRDRTPEVLACKRVLGLVPVRVIPPPAPVAKPVPVAPPANQPGHPVAPLVTPGMYFK